ncbi:hypothetical protein F2Q68_00039244 [Brassica cretica]|uniref:Uncharacterized protein n=1 Tax=Brassica cretica TaxID=69181 RepID=A0A8S9MEY0_BRACR|nr:hypothetical protein F2Q68_00039244 [Brassica cretica]
MSSSQGDKRSSDVEMGEATSQAPVPASSVEAPACVAGFLSFLEKLAHRKAEKEQVRADTELPSSFALAVSPTHGFEPTGSSTTPILVEDKEKAAESMPPPPARKEIVLALHAPSAAPVVQPKGRKRRCTTGNDRESSQQEGLNLAPGLRGKPCFVACFLPTCSEDPEGKDPVVGENGGDAALSLDEAMGEEEV